MSVTLSDDNAQFQAADDLELLELMLADLAGADPVYQPTNSWAPSVPLVLAELRAGLHDFRRRDDTKLAAFGACDAAPKMLRDIETTPDVEAVLAALGDALNGRIASGKPALVEGLSILDLYDTAYRVCAAQAYRASTIKSVHELEVSRVGNPFGFEQRGRFLTRSALFYYMRYAYVAEHVDFHSIDTVVELGSGAGKQAEVLKRLHPDLTIVLLDLAPQLYVAERFLTAAYPEETVPYRDTRAGACGYEASKIHFLANARIADMPPTGRTLFWSAASLGDVEPDVVANFGRCVTPFADWLYLGGVFEPLQLPHYVEAFPEHEVVDCRPAHTGLAELVERAGRYDDTFWTRRGT